MIESPRDKQKVAHSNGENLNPMVLMNKESFDVDSFQERRQFSRVSYVRKMY